LVGGERWLAQVLILLGVASLALPPPSICGDRMRYLPEGGRPPCKGGWSYFLFLIFCFLVFGFCVCVK